MKKRSIILVLAVTVICCLTMALVDGVLRPGYAAKSAIKVAMFVLIPLIASKMDQSVSCSVQRKKAYCRPLPLALASMW